MFVVFFFMNVKNCNLVYCGSRFSSGEAVTISLLFFFFVVFSVISLIDEKAVVSQTRQFRF